MKYIHTIGALAVGCCAMFNASTASARDCGWTQASKTQELSVDYSFCPENRQGDKRLFSIRYTFKGGRVDTADAVIDCRRFVYVEGDTVTSENGTATDFKVSPEHEKEVLLNGTYRAIAKRVCGGK